MYMHKREKIKNLARLILCITAFCATVPVFAADNSCEDEESVVNPALALCSTHVYNIGQTQNPSGGADKETMKEVIALKTTIMTQQMYKQYEYLEAIVKRLKTQLEKAVLTAKLKAAGADSGDKSSSSYSSMDVSTKSNDKYVVLDGAVNCNNEKGTTLSVYECLQNNLDLVLSALENNKTGDAKKQLSSDILSASRWDVKTDDICKSLSSKNNMTNCVYDLRRRITVAADNYEIKHLPQSKQ